MQALFQNKKGDTVEAVLVKDVWQIVTREKKPVRVHRRNTIGKRAEQETGKVLKEVCTVEAELTNDEFKAQFTPANHAAVDLMDKTPKAKELPKPKKAFKQTQSTDK